jgi:hypothetical protein
VFYRHLFSVDCSLMWALAETIALLSLIQLITMRTSLLLM